MRNTDMHRGWLLFSGILGSIAGLVVLKHPLLASVVVANVVVIIVAVLRLMLGLVDLAQAFSMIAGAIGAIFSSLRLRNA